MGLILAPISLLLFIIVFIIESFFSFFFEVKDRKWYQLISSKMHKKAKDVDIFGNYLFGDFWNWVFSNNSGYSFGTLGETISSVLGKKSVDNSLSIVGWVFYYVLYFIDIPSWRYGGHCRRWRMTGEQIREFTK